MNAPHVAIVGGGLAGLSAAEALSHGFPDIRITVLESKRITGGRAGSYIDPETRTEVDYCQHAAMGCCTNLIDMLARCELDQYFRRFETLTFLHPETSPSRFAPSRWLPPPLHLLGTINALHYLSAAQKREIKRGLWKLMRVRPASLADLSAADWLARAGQSTESVRRFWDVILVSALGEQTDRVAMSAARKVIIDGFAAARGASDVLVPNRPLADLFGRKLAGVLSDRGVEIRTGENVRQITTEGHVLTGDSTLRPESVICAVPWHRITKLFQSWSESDRRRLPDLEAISKIPGSPISGLHLWFDTAITDLDHAVMVGTVAQWLFRDPCDGGPAENRGERPDRSDHPGENAESGHYYQVVISASAEATSVPRESLLASVLAELRHAFPAARNARLLNHRLVTDPKSVFSIRPEVDAIRPTARTRLPWLALAGDWIRTGWPATMEGAVISGRLAATVAAETLHPAEIPRHRRMVCGGLSPGFLARRLIRDD